uniref:Uncharacterized protein n=2 Tax=Canis lupus familiaris TaxID=9615 RepID=A0A8C0RE71_CANLF
QPGWLSGVAAECGVGWSQRRRMAEKMAPKAATGKECGGRRRGKPGLFRQTALKQDTGPPVRGPDAWRRFYTNRLLILLIHVNQPICGKKWNSVG